MKFSKLKFEKAKELEAPLPSEEQMLNIAKQAGPETTSNDDTLKENFWAAYDALAECEVDLIKQGIRLAIEIQTAIVNQGTSLIEKKHISTNPEMRYAVIYNDNLQEIKFFQHPLALQKLALFVMEAYKQTKTKIQDKPLVLCVLNSKTNVFLVVGVTGPQGMHEIQKK